MLNLIKAVLVAGLVFVFVFLLSGCDETDSKVVSRNLSVAADNFEINRRIVFYNGITGEYMLSIEGLCSKDDTSDARKLSITCKVGAGRDDYKRHLLGLSDNVTYFIEQLEPVKASKYHYRVVFKPSTIIPDVDAKLGYDTQEPYK